MLIRDEAVDSTEIFIKILDLLESYYTHIYFFDILYIEYRNKRIRI